MVCRLQESFPFLLYSSSISGTIAQYYERVDFCSCRYYCCFSFLLSAHCSHSPTTPCHHFLLTIRWSHTPIASVSRIPNEVHSHNLQHFALLFPFVCDHRTHIGVCSSIASGGWPPPRILPLPAPSPLPPNPHPCLAMSKAGAKAASQIAYHSAIGLSLVIMPFLRQRMMKYL